MIQETRLLLVLLLGAAGLCQLGSAADAKVAWIKEHAIPFSTVKPGSGFEDLQPLKRLIGEARIVSLGESTHGSREIFQMKHRLVEFLATEMGFTIFSIEASMPDARRVNTYVLAADGDPKYFLSGMKFWTWNTEEVLALVDWMQDFNRGGRGRMEFSGFDMQYSRTAIYNIYRLVRRHAPDLYPVLKEEFDAVTKIGRKGPPADQFGVATGRFPVAAARGKKLVCTGWIRTEEVKGMAAIWWRADDAQGKRLVLENMSSIAPRGNREWEKYRIEMDVPAETETIVYGVLMGSSGQAWFDDLKVTIAGQPFAGAEPFDFGFESDRLQVLKRGRNRGFQLRFDREHVHGGKQSLMLRSIPTHQGEAGQLRFAHESARRAYALLEQSRDEFLAKAGPYRTEDMMQDARVVTQATELKIESGDGSRRDRHMADNVTWLLKQNPGAKIVLWAHNGHVARRPGRMGAFLHERFGESYLPVGFATAVGKYQAQGQATALGEHSLQQPIGGSAEAVFQKTKLPRFVLDLRSAKGDSKASGWLTRPTKFRAIGSQAMDQQFNEETLSEFYDLVVYLEETSRARPNRR